MNCSVSIFRTLLVCLCAALFACNSHHPIPSTLGDGATPTVAVVAVAKKKGLKPAINRNALAQQMAQFIRDEQRYDVPVVGLVSQQLGKEAYNTLLNNYTEHGSLSGADLEALRKAKLGARYAVLARLEFDEIIPKEPKIEPVYNNQGKQVTDRTRVVTRTDRTTVVSGMMIDLQNGATVWHNDYSVTLNEKTVQTQYSGSSFAGSLTATFANALANGLRAPDQPKAPNIAKSMRTLLQEIAQNM